MARANTQLHSASVNKGCVRWISNAGILVKSGDISVLVDGLHRKVPRFSGTPAALAEQIICGADPFSHIDYALVTHAHIDHLDTQKMVRMLESHQETTLISPANIPKTDVGRWIRPTQEEGSLCFGDVVVRYVRTLHEGAQFADVIHYAYRVELPGGSFIVLADTAIEHTATSIRILEEKGPADAVFVDFPLIALHGGREQLKGARSHHVFGYHLPFPEDDTDGFRKSAQRAAQRVQNALGIPVTMLLEPDQTEAL